jgi:hypothetical protein
MTALQPQPDIRLFVGGHASRVQGEVQDLAGDRMFSAAHPAQTGPFAPDVQISGCVDSGAFTDPPERRLALDAALERQFVWEERASAKWGIPFRALAFASYDRLIDEKWVAGKKHKQRWTIKEAESAVVETVAAARYLDSQRKRVAPRTLILACQGVDAFQYQECVTEVLKVAQPYDWIGLGGWCILGLRRSWIPTFWQTIRLVLPQIAQAGVKHVHIFGVLLLEVLGGLLWQADRYQLTVSTDNAGPILNCTWKDQKKAGARMPYWRDNVRWWQNTLANLRTSEHYKAPPELDAVRQETFL